MGTTVEERPFRATFDVRQGEAFRPCVPVWTEPGSLRGSDDGKESEMHSTGAKARRLGPFDAGLKARSSTLGLEWIALQR